MDAPPKKNWADYTPDAELSPLVDALPDLPVDQLPDVELLGPDLTTTDPMAIVPQETQAPPTVFQSKPSVTTTVSSSKKPAISTPEMAALLSSFFGSGGSTNNGDQTAVPRDYNNNETIESLGVPREKIKLLIRSLLENSKEETVPSKSGKPMEPRKTYWDALKLYLWRSAPKTEESAAMEAYLPNIPLVIGEAEINQLVELSESKWDPDNVGDTLQALESIGLFDDSSLVQTYHEDMKNVQFNIALKRRVEAFAESTINLVKIAVIARIFPFAKDLNDRLNVNELVQQCIAALNMLFEEGRKDGQLKAALKRVVQRYLRKYGAENSLEARQEMDNFYNMKENQNIEALSVDSFFYRKNCPLFTKYGHPKVLGAGSYGIVLRYLKDIPESAVAPAEEYAIKIQRVTTAELKDLRTAAYVELRLLYEVNRAAPHLKSNPGAHKAFANHVYLHDWVRCQFNARERLFSIMTEKQREEYQDFLQDKQGIYQIYVEEFVSSGTLEHLLTVTPTSAEKFTRMEAFSGIMVQTFAHLQTLGALMRFTHHDMKPENILVQTAPKDTPIKYLVYESTSRGTLYVPLSHTEGCIIKVADYGRGRAEVEQILSNGTVKKIQVGQTAESAYNPGHDVENMLLMYLSAVIKYAGDYPHTKINRTIFEVIKLGIHPDFEKMKSADPGWLEEAISDYLDLNDALDLWSKGKSAYDAAPERYHAVRIRKIIHRCYSKHLFLWENSPRSQDLTAFIRILSHPFVDAYTVKPKDLNSKNSVVMNRYSVETKKSAPPQQTSLPAQVVAVSPDVDALARPRPQRPVTRSMAKKQ